MFRARDSNLWYSKKGVHIRENGKFVEVKRQYQPSSLLGLAGAKVLDSEQKYWFTDKIIKDSGEIFECVHYWKPCEDYHNHSCRCKPQLSRSSVGAENVSLAAYKHIYCKPSFVYVKK